MVYVLMFRCLLLYQQFTSFGSSYIFLSTVNDFENIHPFFINTDFPLFCVLNFFEEENIEICSTIFYLNLTITFRSIKYRR